MAGRNEAKITFRAETEQFNNQIKNANSTLATLRATMALNQAQFKNTGDAAEYCKRESIWYNENRKGTALAVPLNVILT